MLKLTWHNGFSRTKAQSKESNCFIGINTHDLVLMMDGSSSMQEICNPST